MTGDRAVRACCAASAAFVAAALVVGALNALSPFERGWWLASYLLLVGGASQLLLGGGQFVVAAGRRAVPPARSLSWTQLALWKVDVRGSRSASRVDSGCEGAAPAAWFRRWRTDRTSPSAC